MISCTDNIAGGTDHFQPPALRHLYMTMVSSTFAAVKSSADTVWSAIKTAYVAQSAVQLLTRCLSFVL